MTAAPSLRFSFRIVARVDPGIPVERRGGDTLEFIPITGGPVSGEIDGEIVPGGGDWCLVRADGTFDVVTCTLAMHHVAPAERAEAVAEMARVLRPGGRLLIADAESGQSLRQGGLTGLLFRHAASERPLDQASDLMRNAGLTDLARSATTIRAIGRVIAIKPTEG